MRSDVRVPRAAGKRLTGTLTRPNVNVPDQNGLAPAVSSSTGSGFRLVLASVSLLLPSALSVLEFISATASIVRFVLGSALLLLQRRNTLRQYITQIARLALRLHSPQLRRATLSLA